MPRQLSVKAGYVIVVLDAGGQGPSAVTTSTRVIGVMMPNEDNQISINADWHTFRVSVDAIEAATGDDFLSDLDPAVQAVAWARVDNQQSGRARHTGVGRRVAPRPRLDALSSRHEDPRRPRPARGVSRHA